MENNQPLLHHRRFNPLPVWSPGRIRQLRYHLAWTQSELANALGIRRATVTSWENAQVQPKRSNRLHLTILADQNRFPLEGV